MSRFTKHGPESNIQFFKVEPKLRYSMCVSNVQNVSFRGRPREVKPHANDLPLRVVFFPTC